MYGSAVAFAAEFTISFILMSIVLFTTNRERLASDTAYFVGALVAMHYTFESPLSGMSTNLARTFGLSTSRQLLARAMDLFHSSVDPHAGRWRVISSRPRRRRSLLRQTSPCQPRTLHLPSCPTRRLEKRILCNDFKMTVWLPIRSLRLTRDADAVLIAEFHANRDDNVSAHRANNRLTPRARQ